MITSILEDPPEDRDWWIPTPDEDDMSLVVAPLTVGNCDSAADFADADDDYINKLYDNYDLSMSESAIIEKITHDHKKNTRRKIFTAHALSSTMSSVAVGEQA